jgi:EAL and modified HD-GYP domain-containing signal transduction protein
MDVFVARQPIFDRENKIIAYELLFRDGFENSCSFLDPEKATAQVITNTWGALGLEELTSGKPAFINFTKDSLLNGLVELIPPENLVVEVLENIMPDKELLEALMHIKEKGYTIAIDDQFTLNPEMEPLYSLADLVKIDLLELEGRVDRELLNHCKGLEMKLLAEKVEYLSQHQNCMDLGFDYFQGFYYQKPEIKPGRTVPSAQLARMRILRELLKPELDLAKLEKIVQADVSLTYRLLRYLNSSFFAWQSEVDSVARAFSLLGENNIRRWLSLAVIADLTDKKSRMLAASSLERAFFSEDVAKHSRFQINPDYAYMAGLLSLLETILGLSFEEILKQLPLPDPIARALKGEMNEFRALLQLFALCQRGAWDATFSVSEKLGIASDKVAEARMASIKKAEELMAD